MRKYKGYYIPDEINHEKFMEAIRTNGSCCAAGTDCISIPTCSGCLFDDLSRAAFRASKEYASTKEYLASIL